MDLDGLMNLIAAKENFKDLAPYLAEILYTYYAALVGIGFSDEEALELTMAYQSIMATGG